MSESAAPSLFVFDTSSLMQWQGRFYPPDIFPALADRVSDLALTGRLIAPLLVKEETSKVGPVDLVEWTEAHKEVWVPNAQVIEQTMEIQGRFPGLLDPKAEYDEADAYIIALARARGGIVVTEETPASEKHKPKRSHFIPDVCRELGVPCISFIGLMRREGWTF